MLRKIKGYLTLNITIVAMLAGFLMPSAIAGVASADVTNCPTGTSDVSKDCVTSGLNCGSNLSINCNASNDTNDGTSSSNLTKLLKQIVNIISIIVGVIAVIMIIVAGLQYITSGGSSEKVGTAKNTVIYAIVGLVIVALAQFIVHFVLGTTLNAVNGDSGAGAS